MPAAVAEEGDGGTADDLLRVAVAVVVVVVVVVVAMELGVEIVSVLLVVGADVLRDDDNAVMSAGLLRLAATVEEEDVVEVSEITCDDFDAEVADDEEVGDVTGVCKTGQTNVR